MTPHNQSLQQTLDPGGSLAVAKAPTASIAAELGRYAAPVRALRPGLQK